MNRALRPSHDPFYALLRPAYPGALERAVILSLTQVLWDRGEANGYALHMTRAPYLDTPRHTVLLHEAFGDHQVANVATETEARTIGARLRTPAVDPGRSLDREPFFGIRPIRNYPWGGQRVGRMGHRLAARGWLGHTAAADHEHAAAPRRRPTCHHGRSPRRAPSSRAS